MLVLHFGTPPLTLGYKFNQSEQQLHVGSFKVASFKQRHTSFDTILRYYSSLHVHPFTLISTSEWVKNYKQELIMQELLYNFV